MLGPAEEYLIERGARAMIALPNGVLVKLAAA